MNQTYELVQQFAQMLRTRSGEQLDTWLAKVAESRIPELQSFLLGIERDKAAVAAGLTLPHSNGIVEGKVNKLKLTEREREVLRLLMEGASNREIAQRLVLSMNTVKRHVYNICGKLGVQSRTQVLVKARALKLV